MKNHFLFVIVAAGVFLSGFANSSSVDAQSKSNRGSAVPKTEDTAKPAASESKLADIQRIVRERRAGRLAPADPCTTAVPVVIDQSVSDSLTSSDCHLTDGSYIDFYDFHGTAGQAIYVTMNSSAFDTYLYLLDDSGNVIDQNDDASNATSDSRIPAVGGVITLSYTGDYILGANSYSPAKTGAYTLTVNSSAACAVSKIGFNQSVDGTFATSDCAINIANQPYYTDLYTFDGTAGQQITIGLSSTAVDAYLVLHTPSGTGSLNDDDSGGGIDARIPSSGTLILPETGTYTIETSSINTGQTGSYTLNVVGVNLPPVTVTGRVLTPDSRSLRGAAVTIINSQNVQSTVLTNSFGLFSFAGVAAGQSYTIIVSSKRFRFASRSLHVDNNTALGDFIGVE